MRTRMACMWIGLGLFLATAPPAAAQPAEGAAGPLVVGTKNAPPFAMQDATGRWKGISIELWESLANQLGVEYEYRGYGDDLQGFLQAIESGELDVAVAALTVNGDREQVMDFTHPFYTTGFGIAVQQVGGGGQSVVVQRLLSPLFLKTIGALALLLLLAGTLEWLVERRANADQFPRDAVRGIGAGAWWAIVSMTTVGYGDKAPKTFLGRIIAVVWMLTAIGLFGTFVATMASALTVSRLGTGIRGPEDLAQARVATLQGSTSEAYLRDQRIPFRYFPSLDEALEAVAADRADAVVYDAPLLQYAVTQGFPARLEVLSQTFGHQDYSIALPSGSTLREPLNRALLAPSTRSAWEQILFRYLEEAPPPPARPQ